ncbi:MAG: glycoside hydrolase family 13 protein [Pseudomonadota bacterium]
MRIQRTIAVLLLVASGSVWSETTLQRVEPPNWWVGMQSSSLQLLVHGDGIGALEPGLDADGVTLENVTRTDNANYLFLDLDIAADAKAGDITLTFSDATGVVLTHDYTLAARESGSADRRGFDARDVVYLITPDRFANGDPDNDNVEGYRDVLDRSKPHTRHGGDLAGITAAVDYIADMGFTQIWLNPVVENAQPAWSYHGYAATDFYKVDPRYGSNDDYRALADAARKRGVGLIIDAVLNHSGNEHWWMTDLPADDWINFDGEFVPTNHHREALLDPYAAGDDRQRFADGWFVETMPDLNQRNPQMANYLIQNSIWWVEYAGLSGIRVDTWPYSDKAFLTEYARRLRMEYPSLGIVGEEWTTNPSLLAYWQAGTARNDGYESYVPNLFDFPLQATMVRALMDEEAWNSGLGEIYRLLANDFLYGDPFGLMIFPDNHDMSRIYTQLGEDLELWKLAHALTLTTRGIPQLYYGSEILFTNPGTESHGVIRRDFPGGWAGDDGNGFTGEGLDDEAREAQRWLKQLLNWRREQPALHRGTLRHFAPEEGAYVYFRGDAAEVMVVLNKGAARELPLARYRSLLNDAERATDVMTGETVRLGETLPLPARGALMLEIAR